MRPIKILFLAANPRATARLSLDEELREIQRRLHGADLGKRFELCAEWAVRADDLPTVVMRHKPDIVHFSSHGSQDGELFLSSADGEPAPVAAPTLSRLFALLGQDIRCVVLNACYSQVQATAIATTIPAVIGMSRALPDKAAVAFAAGFYEALAFGKNLRAAFELARLQLELAQQGAQREVPQLVGKTGVDLDQLTVGDAAASAPVANVARRTRRVPALIGGALLIAAIVAVWWTLSQRQKSAAVPGPAPVVASPPAVLAPVVEKPVAPLPAPESATLRIGSGNQIKAQPGSRVRAGVFGGQVPAVPAGTRTEIGSGNRIEASPNSTVETGIIVDHH